MYTTEQYIGVSKITLLFWKRLMFYSARAH